MDYQTIYDIASAAVRKQNKYVLYSGVVPLDAGEAAAILVLGIAAFKKWKPIAYGGWCIEDGTHSEAILLHFGIALDSDAIGIATFTQTDPSILKYGNYFADDPQGITAGTKITDTGCSVAYTNGTPDQFDVWQTETRRITAKTVTNLTSGIIYPFVIIEVDTGNKW